METTLKATRRKQLSITFLELPPTLDGRLFGPTSRDVYSLYRLPSRCCDLLAAIARAFEGLQKALEKVPEGPKKAMAAQAVAGLKAEAEKGEDADGENVRQWFESLALMLPDIGEVAMNTFLNPVYGLATAFTKIAQKAKEGQEG